MDHRQAVASRPREPKDFYDGGALLTVGAHKGSGLSIIVDLLAGAISTGRSSDPDDTRAAQQHAVDLYRSSGLRFRRARSRAKSRDLSSG